MVGYGAAKLARQPAATAKGLHDKFSQEPDTFSLEFKGLSTFYSGLEGVIGPPQPDLQEGLRRDHCKADDSNWWFTAMNYGVNTTSLIEWWFVVNPKEGVSELKLQGEKYPEETQLEDDEAEGAAAGGQYSSP